MSIVDDFNSTEIARLNDNGWTVQEISRIMGLKRPTVYYKLRKLGLRPNVKRAPEITARQFFTVLKLYEDGYTKAEISRRVGITYDQVRYALDDSHFGKVTDK